MKNTNTALIAIDYKITKQLGTTGACLLHYIFNRCVYLKKDSAVITVAQMQSFFCHLHDDTIYRALRKLKKLNIITINSNKYSKHQGCTYSINFEALESLGIAFTKERLGSSIRLYFHPKIAQLIGIYESIALNSLIYCKETPSIQVIYMRQTNWQELSSKTLCTMLPVSLRYSNKIMNNLFKIKLILKKRNVNYTNANLYAVNLEEAKKLYEKCNLDYDLILNNFLKHKSKNKHIVASPDAAEQQAQTHRVCTQTHTPYIYNNSNNNNIYLYEKEKILNYELNHELTDKLCTIYGVEQQDIFSQLSRCKGFLIAKKWIGVNLQNFFRGWMERCSGYKKKFDENHLAKVQLEKQWDELLDKQANPLLRRVYNIIRNKISNTAESLLLIQNITQINLPDPMIMTVNFTAMPHIAKMLLAQYESILIASFVQVFNELEKIIVTSDNQVQATLYTDKGRENERIRYEKDQIEKIQKLSKNDHNIELIYRQLFDDYRLRYIAENCVYRENTEKKLIFDIICNDENTINLIIAKVYTKINQIIKNMSTGVEEIEIWYKNNKLT